MIAILYPLKMDKNLSEAYSSIYEVSADLAIKAAKGAEKKRAESAKAGDTEGAKKAMGQNKKFFDYAKGKRQKENMPKKPTGPMANKPMPDPTSSYPGTPQIMKQGKMVKNSYEPEDDMVEGYKKIDKKKENKMYRRAGNLARQSISSNNEKEKYDKAKKSANIVSAISSQKEKERFDNMKTKKSELYNDTTGKYRAEWEQLKLMEMNDYRESFDEWITSIVEEGYDIERWTDEEMVDTFINELNLYNVQESVYDALMSVGDLQEGDKKGKGSGTKDACYHKVKSRYSVWPSAYASGALVKCRKAGASNWGNSSKKEEVEYDIDEGALVSAAKGIEKVGGAVIRGAKSANRAIDRADKAVTSATMNRVVKPAAKGVGKAALAGAKLAGKAALKTGKVAGRTAIGAIKGAAKGGYKAFRNQEDFSDWRSDMQVITEKDAPYGEGRAEARKKGASSETRGRRIYNRARELAQDRYRRKSSGVGQNERAGYNLSRTLQGGNRNKDLRTQGGPQTGGNQSVPHSLGGFVTPRAQRKSLSGTKDTPGKGNPIKKKSALGDTGSHQKKADTMRTTKKDGSPLKKPTFKYKPGQRANIGDEGRAKRKDPKQNPKHQKNTGVVKNPQKQERKEKVKKAMSKEDYNYVNEYAMQLEYAGMIKTALKPVTKAVTRQAIKVGGKTGGKIAQAGMRAAGTAVKDQVKQTAVGAAAGAVNKAAEKVRSIGKPKPQPQQQTGM